MTAALRLRPDGGAETVVYIPHGNYKLDPAQNPKRASSYRLLDAANSRTDRRNFTARPEAIKKLRALGGFQAAFPL